MLDVCLLCNINPATTNKMQFPPTKNSMTILIQLRSAARSKRIQRITFLFVVFLLILFCFGGLAGFMGSSFASKVAPGPAYIYKPVDSKAFNSAKAFNSELNMPDNSDKIHLAKVREMAKHSWAGNSDAIHVQYQLTF